MSLIDTIVKKSSFFIATGFGLGLIPKAPGTFGSLLGIPLGIFLSQIHFSVSLPMIALVTAIGILIIKEAEKSFKHHDASEIVLDEIVGQAIPLMFVEPSLMNIGLSFIFFRLFDIVKKGPVGWADRNIKGATGIMIDDVVAGILAALVVYSINLFL